MPESVSTPRPPVILVVSDAEWSARSFESILGSQGYAVLRASSGRQAMELSRTAQPSAFIIERSLPDTDGVTLCSTLRSHGLSSASTPVIITSPGPLSYSERLEACKCGAWDVLTQPFDSALLLLKLDTFVRARREVEELREASLVDAATGLYNAGGLARRAREIGGEVQRLRAPLACVAFMVEFEEPVHDMEQGAMSDVAQHVGTIFRRTGRVSDAIGRLGQSEFAVVAPSTEASGAVRLAERVQEMLAREPAMVDGKECPVRLRAGYAAASDLAESSADAVELLMRASAALRHGRGRRSNESILAFQPVPNESNLS